MGVDKFSTALSSAEFDDSVGWMKNLGEGARALSFDFAKVLHT
jgi:hypothetical protein